ncbi:hypothetical protein BDV98DRAFT_584725 [Pterulicium gracile]|uniref:Uncharacterized protein n=1 Tax=Pterulicium gracile TaxID=1884261 RepID=A0A5C3QEL1_9AGAR|nr:hypothetical protein BDV98DRAFT_584725 [Pterula gracilis]
MRYLPVGPGELPVDVKARTIAEVDYPKTGEVFAKKWRAYEPCFKMWKARTPESHRATMTVQSRAKEHVQALEATRRARLSIAMNVERRIRTQLARKTSKQAVPPALLPTTTSEHLLRFFSLLTYFHLHCRSKYNTFVVAINVGEGSLVVVAQNAEDSFRLSHSMTHRQFIPEERLPRR